MWYSYFKNRIDNALLSNIKLWTLIMFLVTIIDFILYKNRSNIWIYELCAISFSLTIVFLTMRVQIGNKITYWLGKNLFGLYILQRVPMILCSYLAVTEISSYLYAIISFLSMIILAVLFNKVCDKLFTVIYKTKF